MTYAYRLHVTYPTPDGRPWARYYGQDAAAPNHEIPDWLAPVVEAATPRIHTCGDRVADRLKYDTDRDELSGVLMPIIKRSVHLSASGAARVAEDMRAFGATVEVERSRPIEWPGTEVVR